MRLAALRQLLSLQQETLKIRKLSAVQKQEMQYTFASNRHFDRGEGYGSCQRSITRIAPMHILFAQIFIHYKMQGKAKCNEKRMHKTQQKGHKMQQKVYQMQRSALYAS